MSEPKEDSPFNGGLAVLCMPVLYQVEPEFFESIMIAASKFGRDKLRYMSHEKTVVHEARNQLAHRFLATDSEWLIFLDADHLIPCGNAAYFNKRGRVKLPEKTAGLNFFERILSHPKNMGIVGASYFDRQLGTQLQCSRGCGSQAEPGFNDRYKKGEITGTGEVLWTATGGMRIHRSVFETIKANKDQFPEIIPPKPEGRWGFFVPNKVGMGEDVSLCLRARKCGIKVWQDYDLRILHKSHHFV